jgi:peptide subunit release factor 1 (eRF1)
MRVKYKCKNCNYKFAREQSITFRYCPYCGEEGTVEVDSGDTAKRILDEVSKYDRID